MKDLSFTEKAIKSFKKIELIILLGILAVTVIMFVIGCIQENINYGMAYGFIILLVSALGTHGHLVLIDERIKQLEARRDNRPVKVSFTWKIWERIICCLDPECCNPST